MRVYLSGPMFSLADQEYNLRLAAKVRALGFEVYCPNESEPINNKERPEITARMIYDWDIAELENSNVYLCQVSEDSGTNWEAGYFDCLCRHVDPARYYGVIGLATDIRLHTLPDSTKVGPDNQAFHINQFVVGGLQRSLGIYLDEESMIAKLLDVRRKRE